MARLSVGERICDIGCAQLPNRFLTAREVVGFDLAEMDIRDPYTEHVTGDVYTFPSVMTGRMFDTILLGEFIEHVERPYDLLRALRDQIAPSGRLILSTPNPLGIPAVVAEYLLIRRLMYTKDHLYYFPPRWVWRLLEMSGYTVIKTVGCGMKLGRAWVPAPVSLSYQVIYVAQST